MDKRVLHFILLIIILAVCTKLSFDAMIIGAIALFIWQIKGVRLTNLTN
jgi:hypothetical protein